MNRYILYMILVSIFMGCATSIPQEYHYPSSKALKNYNSTTLWQIFGKESQKYHGLSGFHLLAYGDRALTARVAMADMAEKSLDIQYYLWHPDKSGLLLAGHILRAADRGVKIRILLDDIGLEGRDDSIASIDAHPNIDIRVFNPFTDRTMHALNFITDFDRLNHRMHNKTFVADNSIAIIGGRNIGDQYFALSKESNFRDLDIVAAGPIVRNISSVFDHFWNGRWSIPISKLISHKHNQSDLIDIKIKIDKRISEDNIYTHLDDNLKKLRSQLISIRDSFVWAEGQYIWDDPDIMSADYEDQKGTMIQKLRKKAKNLKKHLYIESAYFIPRDSGIESLKILRDRGVKVRVLTNSLASNDVVPAHAGYANYRKDLIRNGVELYELRSDVGGDGITNDTLLTDTQNSGLHTKTMVFDDDALFIGSFNLDPRSASINTEGGLYIQSDILAQKVMEYMEQGIKPQHSYRVVLNRYNQLIWVTYKDSKMVIYHLEPKVGILKKIESDIIRMLPVELQL